MTFMNFDTLTYSKNLIKAGETQEIAEVHAITIKNIVDTIDDDLVTKDYLDTRLKEQSSDLIIKLGGLMISGVAMLAVFIKVL